MEVTAGNFGYAFTDTLTADGEPVSLAGRDVLFILRPFDSDTTTVAVAATVVDPDAGTVRFDVADGDITEPGMFRQQWRVIEDGDILLDFPTEPNVLRVRPAATIPEEGS